MNVFKTYSILLIAIFILSLRSLNAPSEEESEEEQINAPSNDEIQEMINNCVRRITEVFTGDDLHKHAQIAIHRFSVKTFIDDTINQIAEQKAKPGRQILTHSQRLNLDQLSRCTYTIDENYERHYFGDVLAYYFSFNKYLLVGQIPDLHTFCNQFSELLEHPELCFIKLDAYYTSDRDTALKVAFYKYRLGMIPAILLKIIEPETAEELIQQYHYIIGNGLRDYAEVIEEERYINVTLFYFDSIKSTFGLKIHSDENEAGNRMLNPLEFCTRRYD